MSKKLDEIVEEIIQTGGNSATPSNSEATGAQGTGQQENQDEQAQSVPTNQEPASGQAADPLANELTDVVSDANKIDTGSGESTTDDNTGGDGSPEGGGENSEDGDGTTTSESGTSETDGDGEGTGDGTGDGEGSGDDSFDINDGDEGIDDELDDDSEDGFGEGEGGEESGSEGSSENSNEDSPQDGSEGTGENSEENSSSSEDKSEQENVDGTGDEEGEGGPNFREIGDDDSEGDGEGDKTEPADAPEESDPAMDTDSTLRELEQAQDNQDDESSVEQATEIIQESKEISDRLGELAQTIVDKYGVEKEGEDGEKEITVDTESVSPIDRYMVTHFRHRASAVLGVSIENFQESIYRLGVRKVLSDAQETLSRINAGFGETYVKLQSKLESIQNHLGETGDLEKDIVLEGGSLRDLSLRGSINLEQLTYAPIYEKINKELSGWIVSMLAQYFKNADEGNKSIVTPFKSTVVRKDADLSDWVQAQFNKEPVDGETSPLLPGNRVLVCLEQNENVKVVKMIQLEAKEKVSAKITVSKLRGNAIKNLINELTIMADVLKRSNRIIVALLNSTNNLIAWSENVDDDDLDNVQLDSLMPLAYVPAISLHNNAMNYAWSLALALETIIQQQNEE